MSGPEAPAWAAGAGPWHLMAWWSWRPFPPARADRLAWFQPDGGRAASSVPAAGRYRSRPDMPADLRGQPQTRLRLPAPAAGYAAISVMGCGQVVTLEPDLPACPADPEAPPMPYAKTSLRQEKHQLREKMRALGLDYRDIAAEFARRYQLRPRAAWREAYGWSLRDTASRINEFRGDTGLDPGGFAGMTAPHLCEHENWPGHGARPSGRRPTPYLLALLAAVYGCTVTDLIDVADREHLPPADLLIVDTYSPSHAGPADGPASTPGTLQPQTSLTVPARAPTAETWRAALELRSVAAHL